MKSRYLASMRISPLSVCISFAGQFSRYIYYTYFPCQFQEKSFPFVQNRHFATHILKTPRKKIRQCVIFSAYHVFFLCKPQAKRRSRKNPRLLRAGDRMVYCFVFAFSPRASSGEAGLPRQRRRRGRAPRPTGPGCSRHQSWGWQKPARW